jgi:type II secretory pathway pseudopilin PulG
VPPPPWRKIALGAVVVLAVLGVAAALIVPEIEEGKDERAEKERRSDAAYEAAKEAKLAREGKLRHGKGEPPPPDASPAEERAARRVLVHDLEDAVTRDARARVRRGNLDGPILATECKVNPPSRRPLERDLGVRRLDYDCVAIRSRSSTGQFVVGHSFGAFVDYEHFRFTWAKSCLIPGEGSARPKC